MAIAGKKKPAGKPQVEVAGMRPDELIQAGLADDFDGTVSQARIGPWDYKGKLDHHVCAVFLTFTPDDGEEFTQAYSAASLDMFIPVDADGQPLDLDEWTEEDPPSGVYFGKIGKQAGIARNSNWGVFLQALADAGYDPENMTSDIRWIEGLRGHFNRVPQKPMAGAAQREGGRPQTILVCTELLETVKSKAKAGGAKKAAGTTAAAAGTAKKAALKATPAKMEEPEVEEEEGEEEPDELTVAVAELVAEAVSEAGDDGLHKSKLVGLVTKAKGLTDKKAAMKLVANPDFLGAEDAPWAFDADSGTLYAAE